MPNQATQPHNNQVTENFSNHNLLDLDNVKLDQKISLKNAEATTEAFLVKAFGDGNCGLNAFALGLLVHIIQGQDPIPEDIFGNLNAELNKKLDCLKKRLKLYLGEKTTLEGNRYGDVAAPLKRWIDWLEQTPFSRENFYHRIRKTFNAIDAIADQTEKNNQNRLELAALQVFLAPALRALGATAHLKAVQEINDEYGIKLAKSLFDDSTYVNETFLAILAKMFQLNFVVYKKLETKSPVKSTHETIVPIRTSISIKDALTISIHHYSGHYDCLFECEDGQTILPLKKQALEKQVAQPAKSSVKFPTGLQKGINEANQVKSESNNQLVIKKTQTPAVIVDDKEKTSSRSETIVKAPDEPKQTAIKVLVDEFDKLDKSIGSKQINYHTASISNTVKVLKDKAHAVDSLEKIAKTSEKNLKRTLLDLNLHKDKEDKNKNKLAHLQLKDFEEKLFSDEFRCPIDTSKNANTTKSEAVDVDAALAYSLQCVEILSFLNNHYRTLRAGPQKISVKHNHTSDDENTPKKPKFK